MNASDYLRVKFQSDRQLALYFQHGAISYASAAKGILSDIYSGAERASWFTSCLIPQYQDVCRELITEEKRLALSVMSIFKHRNVIAFMIYLYFKKMIEDSDKRSKEKIDESKRQNTVKKAAGILVKKPTGMATRLALAYSLSESLSASGVISKIVVERVSKIIRYSALALQIIGIEQKMAVAAKELKAMDPEYYWILYKFDIEMLYYFIKPFLDNVINDVKNCTYNSFEELNEALKDKYLV